jgi:putative hemolysin
MEIAVLLILILLNGVFAMSEIALVTARRARLQRFVEEGDRGAIAAVTLAEDPTSFLSTVQIGITSIGILNGIVGQAALAAPVSAALSRFGVAHPMADYLATALVVVIITYASIVLGELVPKRLGQMDPERIARRVARPVQWLATGSKPFVKALTASTHLVLRLLGVDRRGSPPVTEDEIHALLIEGSEAGVIEPREQVMVRNLFRLDDRTIASFMVPRSEIVALDASESLEQNLERVAHSEHSRYPLVRGGWHDVVGIVRSRTLLAHLLRHEPIDLAASAIAPVYVPESVTGMELLETFRSAGHLEAFVIDEYGEILGFVTMRDLVEAITGEFSSNDATTSWAVQREDGSWLLDGLIPVPELKDRLGLRGVPEEERERYHTLSGMMMLLLGRVPAVGDRADWEGWRLEIVDMDGNRIDKVLASAMPQPADDEHD